MLNYDDTKLMQLFRELGPEGRKKALRGAMSRGANRLRKAAVENLALSNLKVTPEALKGVRRAVYRKRLGFRITIGSRDRRGKGSGVWGIVKNSKGKEKPILMWAEGGTDFRRTKRGFLFKGSRRAHSTGRMGEYGFMKRTREDALPGIEEQMRKDIVASVERIAKRYGCR